MLISNLPFDPGPVDNRAVQNEVEQFEKRIEIRPRFFHREVRSLFSDHGYTVLLGPLFRRWRRGMGALPTLNDDAHPALAGRLPG